MQNLVRDELLKRFPKLNDNDIMCVEIVLSAITVIECHHCQCWELAQHQQYLAVLQNLDILE